MKFFHDTTLTFPVGPEGGEDTVDIEVRLHCDGRYRPAVPARIRYDEFDHPEEPAEAEISLERVEIRTDPLRDVFRPAVRMMSSIGDDGVIAAAEAYVDDQPDALVASLTEATEAKADAKGGW